LRSSGIGRTAVAAVRLDTLDAENMRNIGPVLSYTYPLGKAKLVAEAKWLPELDVSNRLKGDIAWIKLGINVSF
jgi:hypothetical protein